MNIDVGILLLVIYLSQVICWCIGWRSGYRAARESFQ